MDEDESAQRKKAVKIVETLLGAMDAWCSVQMMFCWVVHLKIYMVL